MRKLVYSIMLVLGMSAALSCEKYDDTEIWKEISTLQSRVSKLEDMCKEMNTNISSLQTVVAALQNNDFITNVAPIVKAGETIGYTITFSKAGSITILNGENGVDGQDGKDGTTPVISVVLGEDGLYYWTINGEYLLDANGNKIAASGRDGKDGKDGEDGADGKDGEDGQDGQDGKDGEDGQDGKDGITPQLKIENGGWYVSVDNGATWKYLGSATSTSSSPIVSVDTSDDDFVSFVLNDGSSISIPRYEDISKLLIGTWKGEYSAYSDRFVVNISFSRDNTYSQRNEEFWNNSDTPYTVDFVGTYSYSPSGFIIRQDETLGCLFSDQIIECSSDKLVLLYHYECDMMLTIVFTRQ